MAACNKFCHQNHFLEAFLDLAARLIAVHCKGKFIEIAESVDGAIALHCKGKFIEIAESVDGAIAVHCKGKL